jgi:hypothetical protein
MELIRTFEQGKLTSDLNDSHIPKGYIKDAQNIRFASTEHDFGGVGVVSNVKGNIDFTYQAQGVPLAYSQNDIIKSASKLDAKGWICYFLYNNISTKSYIFLRDVNNNANSKILLSSDYTNLNLRFQLSETIDSDMCYVDEDRIYVFWCDSYGVRYINIVKALAGQYGDVSDLDISICKYSPLYCATFIPTGSDITENLVTIEAYQYTYNYIYDDNTSSYFSPYSAINFDPQRTTLVTVSVDAAFVKKVQVFAKNVYGNNANFYLIGTIENSDGSMLSIGNHTIEHTGSSYMAITEPDMDKFNNVAVSASSLTLVNHNVLALSGYKSFYDDWDDKKYNATITATPFSSEDIVPALTTELVSINLPYYNYKHTLKGKFNTGDIILIRTNYLENRTGPGILIRDTQTYIVGIDNSYSKIISDLVSMNFRIEKEVSVEGSGIIANIISSDSTSFTMQYANGFQANDTKIYYISDGTVNNPINPRITPLITPSQSSENVKDSELVFNGSGDYNLSLLLHDKYGRVSNPYILGKYSNSSISSPFKEINIDFGNTVNILPSWCTHYSFGISRDIRFSKYIEVPFGNASPPVSGTEHDFGMDYAENQGFFIIKCPRNAGYTASKGEIFDCIYIKDNDLSNKYLIKMSVIDVVTSIGNAGGDNPNFSYGNIILSRALDWGKNSIIDYTTITTTGNDNNWVKKLVFYEKQNNENIETIPFYQIPNSIYKVSERSLTGKYSFRLIGDYLLKAKKTTSNGTVIIGGEKIYDIKLYLEKSNITIGKPIIYEKNPIRIWNNTVIHSGEIIPQTNVNNLNKFYSTAYQDCDRSKGVIKRIRYDDSRGVVVWFENGIERIPVNSSLIENVDSKTLAISAKLLNLPQSYEGNYGIGNAVNTLAKLGTQWFWLDPINKCIARIGGDGIKDISEIYGMKKFMLDNTSTNNKSLDVLSIGGSDSRNGEYLLTIFQNTTSSYKTLSFSVKNDGFSSLWSYLPQYIINCQNMLFTFNGGKIYKHGVGDINTFYSTYASSKITLLFNEEIGLLKTFKRLEIRSDKLWIPSLMKTDFGINISDLDASSFTHDGGYDNINKNFITDKIANVEVGGDIKEFNGYMLETTLEYSGNEPNYLNFIKIIY